MAPDARSAVNGRGPARWRAAGLSDRPHQATVGSAPKGGVVFGRRTYGTYGKGTYDSAGGGRYIHVELTPTFGPTIELFIIFYLFVCQFLHIGSQNSSKIVKVMKVRVPIRCKII